MKSTIINLMRAALLLLLRRDDGSFTNDEVEVLFHLRIAVEEALDGKLE